jgi:hypothetical protein
LTTWQARDRKINRASAERGVSSLGKGKFSGVEGTYVSLKGSVKSDEASSLTGVWITFGTSADVRTGSEIGLAYTLPRLMCQNWSLGHKKWQQALTYVFGCGLFCLSVKLVYLIMLYRLI